MRASNKVRSLNFPHGLARVSSRTIGVSASCATRRRIGEPRKTISGRTGFSDLSLYLLAFCDDLAQGEQRKHCECFVSGSSHTATIKLLNFASALTGPFRIVWTVTILQQALPCFLPRLVGARRSANASNIEASGNREMPPPAEGLSKGWRFFPTYAHA